MRATFRVAKQPQVADPCVRPFLDFKKCCGFADAIASQIMLQKLPFPYTHSKARWPEVTCREALCCPRCFGLDFFTLSLGYGISGPGSNTQPFNWEANSTIVLSPSWPEVSVFIVSQWNTFLLQVWKVPKNVQSLLSWTADRIHLHLGEALQYCKLTEMASILKAGLFNQWQLRDFRSVFYPFRFASLPGNQQIASFVRSTAPIF